MQLTPVSMCLAAAGILIAGFLLGRLLRKSEGEGIFARIFKDNKDFDSTLDRISISAVILVMLFAFHDDMTDPAKGGLIINVFLMAFNAWQALVLGKAMKDIGTQQQNLDGGEVRGVSVSHEPNGLSTASRSTSPPSSGGNSK